MKSLKSKASRFFKDSPSQDEKVANATLGADIEFDAGIQGREVKKKPSRFFLRKNDKVDKALPAPPSNASSTTSVSPSHLVDGHLAESESQLPRASIPNNSTAVESFPSAPIELATSPEPLSRPGSAPGAPVPEPEVKPAPSFATLRSKSSRFFRNEKPATTSPPPPLPPQIPVGTEAPGSRRPSLTLYRSTRDSRSSSKGHQSRCVSISKPVALPQYSNVPIPENPVVVAFQKRAGPPPPRPGRPESLDDEIIAFMQQGGMRMVLTNTNRMSDSTASSSTPRSHASSIEGRLGLPSGNGSPRSYSLESPLAARFPLDALKPLPVRDSTGSVRYSGFSQYVRNETGGFAYTSDGVDEEDRDLGPIELYDANKEGEWNLQKRISKGPNGNPGMLFRDRSGGFHFVADI
ncbi:hypothetical protein FB567DRAFT_592249 [Paraphoma chrysanthemicola]|uniref:Uncharacterized protein n=1 Tax=Paraphoma chrysanthemicola TaxID=798071 RepID=A0A8K0VZJ0_9PLEO|nr:hypothetical protein FB567DRAFT_592249 [Paraphoma chrysanthemicola]